jgi:hypothetical protein
MGVTCSPPQVTFYSDVCVTTCGNAVPLTGCVASPTACPNFKVGESTPDGGACMANSMATVPAVSWAEEAQVCQPQAPSQGSCSAGEVCLSEGSGAFCIMQAGMVECPAGDYSFSHTFYSGANDTRACSTCSCAPPSGGSCSLPNGPTGPLAGFPYLDPACGAQTGAFYVESCIAIPTVKAVKLTATPTLNAGTCAATGGAATGTASPAQPTTLCCTR